MSNITVTSLRLAYKGQAKTIDNKDVLVSIYTTTQKPNQGGGTDVRIMANGITLNTQSSGSYVTYGSHATQLSISLWSDSDRRFEWLGFLDDRECFIELHIGGKLYWRGSLDTEQWEEPYSFNRGYVTNFTFSDLGLLDRTRVSAVIGSNRAVVIKDFIADLCSYTVGKNIIPSWRTSTNIGGWRSKSFAIPDDRIVNYNAYALHELDYSALSDIAKKEANFGTSKKIENAIIDTSIWLPQSIEEEDEEPSAGEVLDDILKSLNLHVIQIGGEWIVADQETLSKSTDQATLIEESDDADIGVTRTYKRMTVTIDPSEAADLKDIVDLSKVTGGNANKMMRIDTTDPTEAYTLYTLAERAENDESCFVSNTYRTEPRTIQGKEYGCAVLADPNKAFYNLDGKDLGGVRTYASYARHSIDDFNCILSLSGGGGLPRWITVWKEEYSMPAPDPMIIAQYCLGLSLEMLLSRGYDFRQSDPKFEATRSIKNVPQHQIGHVVFDHPFEVDKLFDKIIPKVKDPKNILLRVKISAGDYQLVNATVDPLHVTMLDRCYWKKSPNSNETCLIQFGTNNFSYDKWTKPLQRTDAFRANWLRRDSSTEMYKDAFTAWGGIHDGYFLFPLPPVSASKITIELGTQLIPIWSDLAGIEGSQLSFPIASIGYANNDFGFWGVDPSGYGDIKKKIDLTLSYYLYKGLHLSLLRTDGTDPSEEEVLLVSQLNEKSYEKEDEALKLSTDPSLPVISRSLLRSAKEETVYTGSIIDLIKGKGALRKVSTAPAIRGNVTCGAFVGTLEELFLAEIYSHYAKRRHTIRGTYKAYDAMIVNHEGKTWLTTEREYNVLRSKATVAIEEIKEIDYNANQIDRQEK